jgi:hypothetical protein
MIDLRVLHPIPDSLHPLRFGAILEPLVDVVLDVPWVESPNLGRRVGELDGETEVAACYETRHPVPVKALASGRAEMRDSGRDDHSGPPARKGNAGRGLEVTVTTGTYFTVSYSHLKRGTARVGVVKAGDVIGQSGNSGRCLDGAKGAYVKLAVRQKGGLVRLEDLVEPIFIEWTANGVSLARAKKLPPGELVHKNFALERAVIESGRLKESGTEEVFRAGENELVVSLRRGSRQLARQKLSWYLEW